MKNIKFEEAMTELELIVRQLESGELTLDDSIKAYERAVALAGICNKKLESAEARVRILTENKNGEVSDAPFDKLEYED